MPTTRYSRQSGEATDDTMVAVFSAKLGAVVNSSVAALNRKRREKRVIADSPCGAGRWSPMPCQDWLRHRPHNAVRRQQRQRGNAYAPCVGNPLVRLAQTLLQRSAALVQSLLHKGCGLLRVSGQIDGQFGFDLLRGIQLDKPLDECAAGDRMPRIRNHPNLGAGIARQQKQPKARNQM